MAGNVQHVIDAAHDPEVAVLVAPGAVAREVDVRDLAPVLGAVPVVVAVDGAEHARPGALDHQVTAVIGRLFVAVDIDHGGLDAEEGEAGRAGLGVVHARQSGDHDAAGFGLPPGVDHRAALAADHAVVPHPRLGVDRLADGA